MKDNEKVLEVLRRLKREYPDPVTALNFQAPFELLVATMLSAQTTDVHVNKIEKDLMAITPKKDWGDLSHLLIFHGRKICQAKKPRHQECVLYDICPSKDI